MGPGRNPSVGHLTQGHRAQALAVVDGIQVGGLPGVTSFAIVAVIVGSFNSSGCAVMKFKIRRTRLVRQETRPPHKVHLWIRVGHVVVSPSGF